MIHVAIARSSTLRRTKSQREPTKIATSTLALQSVGMNWVDMSNPRRSSVTFVEQFVESVLEQFFGGDGKAEREQPNSTTRMEYASMGVLDSWIPLHYERT